MTDLPGVPVLVDPHLPTTRYVQFRFPRSRKARIRKKWRKNPKNWHHQDCTHMVYIFDKCLLVRPEVMAVLKEKGIA